MRACALAIAAFMAAADTAHGRPGAVFAKKFVQLATFLPQNSCTIAEVGINCDHTENIFFRLHHWNTVHG